MRTPHLDSIARGGTTFAAVYCQQALCSPSRISLMTGRRPDTTRVYNLEDDFRVALPDIATLPQHFKAHGYHAQSWSKIYHNDDAVSWSVPSWASPGLTYGQARQVLAAPNENKAFFLAAGHRQAYLDHRRSLLRLLIFPPNNRRRSRLNQAANSQ